MVSILMDSILLTAVKETITVPPIDGLVFSNVLLELS